MVIRVHNLDKCINRFKQLARINDAPVGIVYTNKEYAIHQEYGFSVKSKEGMVAVPPQPFMRPALSLNKKLIESGMSRYLSKQISLKKEISLYDYIHIATRLVQKTAKYLVPISVRRGIQAPKVLRDRPSKKGEGVGGALRDSIHIKMMRNKLKSVA